MRNCVRSAARPTARVRRRRALETEMSVYAQLFEFEPAGGITRVELS
jgi:hypothetical protein